MLNYLIIINIISFVIYGVDKYFAINNKYRISENLLLFLGFVGGVLGSILGMIVFRHKIRKIKFKVCLFMYFVLWVFILYKILFNF